MSGNFIDTAFAEDGDLTTVPDTVQPDGSVSFPQGYGSDYELPLTSAGALPIERTKMNWLFNFITLQIQQYQTQSSPLFITSSENGGTAYSYPIGITVIYNPGSGNRFYKSLKSANVDLPTVTSSWADVTLPFTGNLFTGGTSTGSANAQVVTTNQGNFTNTSGHILTWLAGFSNTAAMTITVDGGSALPVKIRTTLGLVNPPPGAVTSSQQCMGISDGTNIELIGESDQPQRILLTSNTTFFVNGASGSDSNTGLTSGSAWATIQHAVNVVQGNYDGGNFVGTITCTDATYAPVSLSGPFIGFNFVQLQGNTSTPATCIIAATNTGSISVGYGGILFVKGFRLQTTTSGFGLEAYAGGKIFCNGIMDYNVCASGHISITDPGSTVATEAAYNITGSAPYHILAQGVSACETSGIAVTLSGTLTFSSEFARAANLSNINVAGNSYTGGTITGTRYLADSNGVISTNGAGATFLPGNASGSTATGGQYV